MKTKLHPICLMFTLLVISLNSQAETIIAIADKGSWNKHTTWDLDRLPKSGDTIYIPFGTEVVINENINFEKYGFSAELVKLVVSGRLSFKGGKNLNLSQNSTLTLDKSGEIIKKSLSEKLNSFISIHLIKVWETKAGVISGPVILGKAAPSPQALLNFEILNNKDSFFVSWDIKQFEEAGYYDLLVSKNGRNWESIRQMKACNNDSVEKTLGHLYRSSKKDNKLYFKLNVCDLNGKTTTLATAKTKRKPDYERALCSIPKMLLYSTVAVFASKLKLNSK